MSSKQLNLKFLSNGQSQRTASTANAVSKTLKDPKNKRKTTPKILIQVTDSKKPFCFAKDPALVEQQAKLIDKEDQKKEEEYLLAPIFKKKVQLKKEEEQKKEQDEEEIKQEPKSTPITPSSAPFPSFETWIEEMGDWKVPLKSFIASKLMKNIYEYIKIQYASDAIIYPPRDQIFNAYRKTSWKSVKVVIVGQDPYIKPNQAMGLSFSIPRSQKTVPPSLKAIYSALEIDAKNKFKRPSPLHGDLSSWAEQGVFMLNASLTVKAGKSNSHKDCGWLEFTKATMDALSKEKEGIIFMLWGKFAQEKGKGIDRKKHHVLEFQHPSPMAGPGFKECKDFSKVNQILMASKRAPIDWNLK